MCRLKRSIQRHLVQRRVVNGGPDIHSAQLQQKLVPGNVHSADRQRYGKQMTGVTRMTHFTLKPKPRFQAFQLAVIEPRNVRSQGTELGLSSELHSANRSLKV